MRVEKLTGGHRNSNTYIIYNSLPEVVIIDPGDSDINILDEWLFDNNKKITAIMLTHEHADHCAGVNHLKDKYNFILYCTKACAENIKQSKQNYSFYIDNIETFEVNINPYIVEESMRISVNFQDFIVIETPGHSPGSSCIFTNNIVFTGDTFLNKQKTPLSFPHSDKIIYRQSIEKLKTHLKKGSVIYPGHGEPFKYTGDSAFIL